MDGSDNIDTYTMELEKYGRLNIPVDIKNDFERCKDIVVVKSSMGLIPFFSVYPPKVLEERINEIVAKSTSPIIELRNGRVDLRKHVYQRYTYYVISCIGTINRPKEGDVNIRIPTECLEYALLSAGDNIVLFLRRKHLEIWRKDVYHEYEELIQRGTNVLPVPLR